MFVCQNHGVRSGLFFSQLENRDVFVSCTVRNNAVELTVSAFLELNDVDNSGCTYLDIDTSPYGVSVIKLSNYL